MAEDWRAQLVRAVSPLTDGVRNLRVNSFQAGDDEPLRPARTAAILVPVLDIERPEILLTRRAPHLTQHAGQISFPGGRAEEFDGTAVNTAMREAEEEIGLSPDTVRPIGFLDRFDSVSDYRVLPVVALVAPQHEWVVDHNEVDEVFTLPLDVALDRGNYTPQIMHRNERSYVVHSIEWQGRTIWGMTAAVLMNLLVRVERQSGA